MGVIIIFVLEYKFTTAYRRTLNNTIVNRYNKYMSTNSVKVSVMASLVFLLVVTIPILISVIVKSRTKEEDKVELKINVSFSLFS